MEYNNSDMVIEMHTHAGTSKHFPAPNHSLIQLTTAMKSPAVNPSRSGRILTLLKGQQSAIHQQLGHGGRNADTTETFRGLPAANHSLTQPLHRGTNPPLSEMIRASRKGRYNKNATQQLAGEYHG